MNQYSNSATLQIAGLAGRGLAWARDCVGSFVDDLAMLTERKSRDRALIFVGESQSDVYQVGRGGALALLTSLRGSPEEVLGEARRKLARKLRKAVRVRFAAENAVVKHIALPAGTLDVLPAIIRNKVEGLAPWPLQRAIWGHRLGSGTAEPGQIGVDVGVLSREFVETAMQGLSGPGLAVNAVDIGQGPEDGESIALDLTSGRRTKSARQLSAWIFAILAIVAIGIGGNGLYLALATQHRLDAIDTRISRLRQSIAGADQGTPATARLAEANKIYLKKQDIPPVVVIFNAISELLPDGVWLSQVKYGAAKVTISGQGTSIPMLIETFEKSKVFKDVNFASATQRDDEGGSDRFSISAVVEAGTPQP
ncbi:MAG: PilN domain-containing protein [Alphaproteobacteria bacterium]|nr:PilN domain-containing protein [Alphaproteobacteria bacterium]